MYKLLAICIAFGVAAAQNCGSSYDPCKSDPCLNGGICKKGRQYYEAYNCTCQNGFFGRLCHLSKTDQCNNYCMNGGTCRSERRVDYNSDKYTKGYRHFCSCKKNYFGDKCEKQHPCVESPCQNGGECQIAYQYGDPMAYMCHCKKGYEGKDCDIPTPDLCAAQPCQEEGKCFQWKNKTTNLSEYFCQCPDGREGKNCEIEKSNPCDNNPCQNEGKCVYFEGGQFFCKCKRHTYGKFCEKFSPCTEDYCNGNGVCKLSTVYGTCGNKAEEKPFCECDPQYWGEKCENLKPCFESDPCKNGGACYATPKYNYTRNYYGRRIISGFYDSVCRCNKNFGGKHCEILSPCLKENPCQNEGQCIAHASYNHNVEDNYKKFYSTSCQCTLDYEGRFCENKKFDPCEENLCKNGATCIRTPFSLEKYKCECSTKFSGKYCDVELSKYLIASCDFEGQCDDFSMKATTSFEWKVIRGQTRSPGTGPMKANSGFRYVYTEASSPAARGDVATITSRLVEFEEEACLHFFYHMKGADMGELKVRIETESNSLVGEEFSMVGQQGDAWHKKSMPIPVGSYRIVFTGIRGSGWSGDIALDDIEVKNGACGEELEN